jgi:hypothetical protein
MTEKVKHVAIIDQIGRNIIGKFFDEDQDTITLTNPVILHVQPDGGGQLQVQSFPLFFFEFIDKGSRDKNEWTFTKQNIVTSNVELDEKIIAQYQKINNPPAPEPAKSAKIVDINDL